MKKSLPERLEELRADRTQKEFARLIGTPLNTYTNWTRGIRMPTADAVVRICTHLNVSADWLLGLSEDDGALKQPVQAVAERVQAKPGVPLYDQAAGSGHGDAFWHGFVENQQTTIANQQTTINRLTELLARSPTNSHRCDAAAGGEPASKPA